MHAIFYECSSITSIDLSNFNCDKIKETGNMENMFEDCLKLKIQNIKHRDSKIRSQIIMDINKKNNSYLL